MNHRLLGLASLLLAACGGTVVTTGGAGGTGGSGGSGGSGATGGSGGSAFPECQSDADCVLLDDCCTCGGVPAGTPGCELDCVQSACSAAGLEPTAALCRAGRCVLDLDCNQNHAACESLPPSCPPGETATVVGPCWGPCAPLAECAEVTGCAQCGALGCVSNEDLAGPSAHCVVLPASCGGEISCACAAAACADQCADTDAGINCFCPTCGASP